MTAPHASQIVDGYLARLELELGRSAPARRSELVDDVRTHIADARAALSDETDDALFAILERLGDPAMLAREAADEGSAERTTRTRDGRWGWIELAGVLLTILMWPVGAILVLLSPVWTLREKVIATALGAVTFLMGPVLTPVMGMVISSVLASLGAPLAPVLLGSLGILPLVAATYLATRLWRRDPYLPGLVT
jgi:uncharacterized membrane protein